jgi:glycerol-3-phosphate cytidylyltransferase
MKGVIAGAFDVIHPGYTKMFNEASRNCNELTILLHTNPSIERPEKLKPVLTIEERIEMLMSLKVIHKVFTYTYESELYELLKSGNFDIRFIGNDYVGKKFTGDDLDINVWYINRDHGLSTTKFKELISQQKI